MVAAEFRCFIVTAQIARCKEIQGIATELQYLFVNLQQTGAAGKPDYFKILDPLTSALTGKATIRLAWQHMYVEMA